MSEPDPGTDPGLFGKLPRARPGARSPRRAAGSDPTAAKPANPGSAARPRTPPRPKPRRPAKPPPQAPKRPPPPPPPASEEGEQGAGLEDLAWAGIAVTAEAATLGVRLMSRAIDTARRAAERR
jgi:hypothetical protein